MNGVFVAPHGSLSRESNLFALARASIMPMHHTHEEEEAELKEAALEVCAKKQKPKEIALPGAPGSEGAPNLVRLSRFYRPSVRGAVLQHVLSRKSGNEDDTQTILAQVRARFDKAGVPIEDVLVRFKNLSVTGLAAVKQPRSAGHTALGALQHLRYAVGGTHPSSMRQVPILDGISSVIKPQRFTLLLGPPGAGKTTFMRALSGQLKGESKLKVTADELTYNGLSFDQFVVERTAAYISQIDTHFGELTVRETLDFSALCQTSRTRKPAEVLLEEKERELGIEPDPGVVAYMHGIYKAGHQNLITDIAIKALGLESCEDTLVGNAMIRGVSGGQKKRVTTGEMFVGPAKVLFADEISTGLDSATTLDICSRLRSLCHTVHATIIVSLLQPTPETYNVFDDIMLLSGGHLVFHGPRECVEPFFESLGFACPPTQGTADFLQEVTTLGDQRCYWTGEKGTYEFITEEAVAAAYRQTEYGAGYVKELEMSAAEEEEGHEALPTHKYGQGWWTLFKANMRRQKMLFLRNDAFIYIRIMQCVFMGIAVGTLFLNTSKSSLEDAQMYMSVAFFSIMTQLVVSFAAPGLLIERLPVYYKQRDAHFYPAWCFALPEILLQVPLIFTEACIWTLLVYFMVGFVTSARLLIFWAFMLVVGVCGLSLFMVLAVFAKTIAVAAALQNLMIMIFTISSGYIINANNLPSVWKGVYWSNPVTYFLMGVVTNEFQSSDWSEEVQPGVTAGEYYLTARGYQTGSEWAWIGLFAWGIGSTILNTVVFMVSCTYLSGASGAVASVTKAEAPEPGSEDISVKGDLEEGGSAALTTPRKSTLPFVPMTMTFQDIKYSVPLPADFDAPESDPSDPHSGRLLLLKGITGSFRPKVLTALMGSSGAGKTTLMDVLALRKTGGIISGDVRINGFPQSAQTFMRVMGYCEQTDIHVPEATVHEALLFSARLRLPSSVDSHAAEDFVEEMMELVELSDLRDATVGMPGVSGLSVEQRKRLTIAVELVANPSIIFMDEPTSGLDARAASIVMRAVRRIVNTGRTVVCTIHQPSVDIFQAFDELLLLKRGGQTIFFGQLGKHSEKLIAYFEQFDGVKPFKLGANPANWMLEVSSTTVEAETGENFADNYQLSDLCTANEADIAAIAVPKEGGKDLSLADLAPASVLVQTRELLKRNLQQYQRLWSYNGTRAGFTLLIAVLFGTVLKAGGDNFHNYNGVLNIVGVQYSATMFIGILNVFMVQSIISLRRTVYYREKAGGTYGTLPYAIAEFAVEIPYLVVQAVVYSLIVYFMIGFKSEAGAFFWFLLMMLLTLAYWTYFGIQNVHITPSLQIANAFTSFAFGVWDLMCGFYSPKPLIPGGWIWMYYINPVAYTLYGLIIGELGDVQAEMTDQPPGTTVADFVRDYFGYDNGFRGPLVVILICFSAIFFAASAAALRFVKWQNR